MSVNRNRLIAACAVIASLSAGPVWAQSYKPVVVDGIPYVLPESAANNLDAVRVLIKASDAQGMTRNVTRTLGGTMDIFEYVASGTMGGQNVGMVVDMDYRLPSIRQDVTRADKSHEITVASGDLSWDESKPGVFLQAGKTPAADRLMPLWLLPPFVVHEGAEHADAIKVADKGNGNKELTIPLARYKTDLKATVNADGQITHTEMNVGGKLYSADFSNYQEDRMQYHVFFPHQIVEKVDGQTVADLMVQSHLPGPYAVWPIPAQLKVTAGK